MAAAGIASQYTSPRTIGLVAGAFGLVTAMAWAWFDGSGRLPEPGVEGATTGGELSAMEIADSTK